jgi:hypothetical protein
MSYGSQRLFDPEFPSEGTRYERRFDAEIDCLTENELLLRGRMSDERFDLEHEWVVRPPDRETRGYRIVEARARQFAGDPQRFTPTLCAAYSGLGGLTIGRGFGSRVMHTLGHAPGNREHLLLAIEMARASQQIYQYPEGMEREVATIPGIEGNPPYLSWSKDRAYIGELANSCFTYRDQSAEILAAGGVRCGFDPDVSRVRPGTRRVFWRTKRLTIETVDTARDGGGPIAFRCQNHMEDRVHDILVGFDLLADGTIAKAHSRGLRLPYHGLCESPHLRTPGLNGRRIDAGFLAIFADQVGGASGCTHIFDLSIDCLRLFRFHH